MMNSVVILTLSAVALLQLVSPAAVPGHANNQKHPNPPPAPPRPNRDDHVTWAPEIDKQVTGHDDHRWEHNDTDHSGEEHAKDRKDSSGFHGERHGNETETFAPRHLATGRAGDRSDEGVTRDPIGRKGLKPAVPQRRQHKREIRPEIGHDKHDRRDKVTLAPRQHGTERAGDSSEEGVTRDPVDKRDHLVTERRGEHPAFPQRRQHKREIRPEIGHDKHDRRDKVTLAPRQHGTERAGDSSEEGVTRDPVGKRDHLVTEPRRDHGNGGRDHPGRH